MDNLDANHQTEFFFEQALPQCIVKVGGYSVELLNWGKIQPYHWHNFPHFHAFYEICYNWTGSGSYTVNGRTHTVSEDNFLFAWPKEEHCMHADQTSPFGVYCASIGIYPINNHADDDLTEMIKDFINTEKICGSGRWKDAASLC